MDAARRGDPAYYKTALPIPFVLEQEGVWLSEKGDRLACLCPFHDDSSPSFDVWQEGGPEGAWRFGCFPCSLQGDVLDLLQRLRSCSLPTALKEASALLDSLPPDWTPPVLQQRKGWDPDAARRKVDLAVAGDPAPLAEFLRVKGIAADVEDLRWSWGVGTSESGEVIIPWYNREGELVAYKYRTASTKPLSAPGSQLRGVLYGEWRDKDVSLPVLLCEGESDAWAASGTAGVGTSFAVLATSAGASPTAAPSLAGRRVLLAFDGDDAGRKATLSWSTALLREGCTVEFVPVPEGEDLRQQDISACVARARSLKPAPDALVEHGDTYVRPGKDVNVMLTNWRLRAEFELSTDEGMTAYEGTLLPSGRRVTLSSFDLSSKARIVSWCSRYGVSWLGSDRDAQMLLALLQHQGPYLPAGRLVSVAGLHDGAFVWPGGRAGRSSLVYDAPQFDVHLEQRLTLPEAEWTALQVSALRGLHTAAVMDPVLGWLAAAPLRSVLPSFPTLAVTGSSGSGKTTLLSTVLAAFSGADISTNLTSTTKHALASFLASTNAFPVWFDEYRPGARRDTQLALEQLLRDAYTGQISAKGGLGEHWSEISAMRTDAPIIVSGEDTFTETSHTERMVNLPLPSRGKNPSVLADVKGWGPTGLPLAYLLWLTRRLAADDLPSPAPAGPADLPSRQRDNLGTVRWGYDLLNRFVQDHGAPALPSPDFSLVEQAGKDAAQHNPIKDALLWALEEIDCDGFVRRIPSDADGNPERIAVRVTNFAAHIERTGVFQLPGRAAAVRRYLLDTYDGDEREVSFAGRPTLAVVINKERLT